jgi:hypothetical protein
VIQVYFYGDESGLHKGAAYCIVSGFIGSPCQWDLLRKQWREALHDFGAPPFHAHDFFSRNKGEQIETRPYHGWDDEKARRFLERLLTAIDNRNLYPIGAAVETGAFRSFSSTQRKFLTSGVLRRDTQGKEKWLTSGAPTKPYFAALDFAVYEALMNTPVDSELHFVLDAQSQYEGRAKNFFTEYTGWYDEKDPPRLAERLGSIVYMSKLKEPALQVADLHANLWYSLLTQPEMGAERRDAWEALSRKRPEMMVLDRSRLEALLRKAGVT